jgi:DNA-binding NtrC family response regulator
MSTTDTELPLVLVVDDKTNMLRLMAKVLRADARVRTATRGAEALRILEDEPVDVILSDLRMPDMDGIEVLKRCKQVRSGAEFILMTAYASVPTAIEALRLGAYDYLTKPFEPEAARAVVLRAEAAPRKFSLECSPDRLRCGSSVPSYSVSRKVMPPRFCSVRREPGRSWWRERFTS